ncbi:MAG: fibronectin type III domain-containing protein [Flavobacterium sp.]
MRKIILLLMFMSALWSYSQVRNYSFSSTTASSYPEITGGTVLGTGTNTNLYFYEAGKTGSTAVTTGAGYKIDSVNDDFIFTYNGEDYDRFAVHTNGWIALGKSANTPAVNMGVDSNLYPLSSNKAISPDYLATRIAPFALALKGKGSTSSLTYKVEGSKPNRVLVIQWKDYIRTIATAATENLNFQVRLYETTNNIEFVYGACTSTNATEKTCQVGLRGDAVNGINFNNRTSETSDWSNTSAGLSSDATIVASSLYMPANGLTYTWTPGNSFGDAKDLVINTLTDTSVTFSWGNYLQSPDGYEYIVSTFSTLPSENTSGKSLAAQTVTEGSLTASTQYYIYMRSYKGSTFNPWVLYDSFKTFCPAQSTLNESFDNQTYDAANLVTPNCWSGRGTTATASCVLTDGIPQVGNGSASNALLLSTVATASPAPLPVVYAHLPIVNNLKSGNYRLRFKAYAAANAKPVDIGYFTNYGDATSFVALTTTSIVITSTTANNMQNCTFVITPEMAVSIPDNVNHLVLKTVGWNGSTKTSIWIDDVIWEAVPATNCPDLTAITFKNPSANSINISWAFAQAAWQYAYAPVSVNSPAGLTTYDVTTPSPAQITGLTSNTNYKLWIRSVCDGTSVGSWNGPFLFSTSCDPVAQKYEAFDVSTTLPDCWKKVDKTTGTMAVTALVGTGSSNALELKNTTTANKVVVKLPDFIDTMSGNYRMRFKVRSPKIGGTIELGYLTDALDASTFTSVKSISVTTANTVYEVNEKIMSNDQANPLAFRFANSANATSLYIDDFAWELFPSCTDLLNISMYEAFGNSVKLNWTTNGNETLWQYVVGDTTVYDPNSIAVISDFSSPIKNGTSLTGTVAGLSPNTAYKVWVRSNCGPTSKGSWMGPLYVSTMCSAVDEYTQDFNTDTNLPVCWKILAGTATVINVSEGNNLLQMNGNTSTKAIVALPPFGNAKDGTYILRFKVAGTVAASKLEVGYLTQNNYSSTFTKVTDISISSTSKTALINVAAILGTNPTSQILAFRNPGVSTNSIYIDDISWEVLPDCTDISLLKATNVTDTSISASWTMGGSEIGWDYAFGDDSTILSPPVAVSSAVIVDGSVSATISGLTASTSYKLWIRPRCTDGITGSWSGPIEFITNCTSVSAFTESFDTNTSLPNCWRPISGTVTVGAVSGPSTPNVLRINAPSSIVALPPVSNSATGTYRLRFRARATVDIVTYATDGTTIAKVDSVAIHVGYMKNPLDPASFQLLQSKKIGKDQDFDSVEMKLGTNITTEVLAFRYVGTAGSIYVDDVIWEAIPPCADITGLSPKKISGNSMVLNWKQGSSETAWQYVVSATETNPNNISPAIDFVNPALVSTTASGSVTGLNPSTNYRVWVRSKCDDGVGAWSDAMSFTTLCSQVATFDQDFEGSTTLPSCWRQADSGNSVIISSGTPKSLLMGSGTIVAMPPVSNADAGTNRLRFIVKTTVANSPIQVGYMSDLSTFVPVWTGTVGSTVDFETKRADLGTGFIAEELAIKNTGTGGLFIDEVHWELKPICPDQTDLFVNGIASNSLTVAWTKNGTETAWQYVTAVSSVMAPDGLSPVDFVNPVVSGTNVTGIATGLSPQTEYKIWIRSNCGNNVFGDWSLPLTFKTLCAPADTIMENFDTSSLIPFCWRPVSNTGFLTIVNDQGASAPNVLKMSANAQAGATIMAMPAINNAAAGTNRLRFKVKGSMAGASFDIGYMSNSKTFVLLKTLTVSSTSVYETKVVDLGTNFTAQELAFRNPGLASTPLDLYIDDVNWEVKPVCPDPSSLGVKLVKSDSADLKWTISGSETAWQYVMSITETTPDNLDPQDLDLNAVNVDLNNKIANLHLSNLTSSSTYKFWVRTVCDENTQGFWIGPLSFTTTCAPVDFVQENFDHDYLVGTFNGWGCWHRVGPGNAFITAPSDTSIVVPSGAETLYLNSQTASSLGIMALPPVKNMGAGTHLLDFKFAGNAANSSFQLGYLTNPSDPASFVLLKTFTNSTAKVFTHIIYLIDTAPGSEVLAFRKLLNGPDIYIDDVSVKVLKAVPTCATNVIATPNADCGNGGTQITWDSVNIADGYKITVGTTSGGTDVLNKVDLGSVTTYTVNAGIPGTTYFYTVIPYTNGGDAIECPEQQFVTNSKGCYCVSVPTSMDGQGITNVTLGTANFSNQNVTYSDHTSTPVNFAKGENTNLKLSFNTNGQVYNVNVWVDVNNNYEFEESERVFKDGKTANTSPNTLDCTFVMPASITTGVHRMRIVTILDNTIIDPCYNGVWGITVDMALNIVAKPANDEASGAIALIRGTKFEDHNITSTNVDATGSINAPTCGNFNGGDVWYSATVPSTGRLNFELQTVPDGITDIAAAVYSGELDNLQLLACNSIDGFKQLALSFVERTSGEKLYLRVWENGGDQYGSFKVSAYDGPVTEPVLGTDIFETNHLVYYPNPVINVLNITMDQEITEIKVVNLLGQQVMSVAAHSSHAVVDMTTLSEGAYLIKVVSGNQSKVVKVLKK